MEKYKVIHVLKERANIRSKIYKALSLSFYEPSLDLVDGFVRGTQTKDLKESLAMLFGKVSELEATVKKLVEDLQMQQRFDTEKLQRNWNLEYTRLFIGPEHVPCPPYESVYRKDRPFYERGLVMGESTIDVEKRYREAGLIISGKHKEIPDHIALELEFMYFLTRLEARSWDRKKTKTAFSCLKIEEEFLEEHLMKWISLFSDVVKKSAEIDFYRYICEIARIYVFLDKKKIESSMKEFRISRRRPTRG